MKKKNPFKMWGSWIGVLLAEFTFSKIPFLWDIILKITEPFSAQNSQNLVYVNTIVIAIIGFLLGWGLEVLIRKNKWFGLR